MGVDAEIYVKVNERPTREQLKRWSWELGNVFFPDNMFNDDDYDAMSIDEERQNGVWLSVDTSTRYYGKDYTRGDFMLIYGIIAWCKRTFPGCPVYYGGDCDVIYEEMTDEAVADLLNFYLDNGHMPYYRCFFSYNHAVPPICKRCACDAFQPAMYQGGSGPEWELWRCAGCGREVERGERAYKREHGHD